MIGPVDSNIALHDAKIASQPTHCPLCIPGMVFPIDDSRPPAVIFLDMDGVMATAGVAEKVRSTVEHQFPGVSHQDYHWAVAWGRHLHPKALTNLHELIDRIEKAGSRALIVISSSWRNDVTTEQLPKDVFKEHHFSRYIAGKTATGPNEVSIAGYDFVTSAKEKYGLGLEDRSEEIEHWLRAHDFDPKTTNYIVIDDNHAEYLSKRFGDRFIQTRTYFRKQDLEKATTRLTPSDHGILQVTNGIHACQISPEKPASQSAAPMDAKTISATIRRYIRQNRPLDNSFVTKPPIIVQELDLSYLCVTPALLQKLAQLFPSVTSITLRGTGIDDAVIPSLSQFKQLQKLDISRNEKIKGTLFNTLPQSLLELDCSFCSVSDQGIAYLARSTSQLQKLNVSANHLYSKITGTSFNTLPQSLLELDCSFCSVSDQGIADLATSTPGLQKLNVGGNEPFCGTCIEKLPQTLIELICFSCSIEDKHLVFSKTSQIQKLNIGSNTSIKGTSFNRLPQTLRELNCEKCRIYDSALCFLATHTSTLQKLDISQNEQITGRTFNSLPESLLELNCWCCSVTDQGIGFLAVHTPRLQRLNISSNKKVTSASFKILPAALLELECQDCSIDDSAIVYLAISAPKLQKLNISWNQKVTGKTFDKLPQRLVELWCCHCLIADQSIGLLGTSTPGLQTLNIFDCKGIKGETFHTLPQSLTNLDCNSCSIDDKAIAYLATSTPKLQRLIISANEKVTGKTFNKLPPELIELTCGSCSVEDQSLPFLATSTPQLQTLILHGNRLWITGKTFDKLPRTLVVFDCSHCEVEEQNIAFLATSTPNLHELNIRQNQNFTVKIVNTLPQSLGILECDRRFPQIEGLPFECWRPSI